MKIDRDKLIEILKQSGFYVGKTYTDERPDLSIGVLDSDDGYLVECEDKLTKLIELVHADAITSMQTELQAAKEDADRNKRLFLQACQTLGKCGELLGIPEDETTGEPFELYNAIEELQAKVTSMQGDSEPVYEMKTHNDIVDNLIEQLNYLDTVPDFNESSTVLYIFEAMQTIQSLRKTCALHETALGELRSQYLPILKEIQSHD